MQPNSPEFDSLADVLCHTKSETINISLKEKDGHAQEVIGYSQTEDLLKKFDDIRSKYCPEIDSFQKSTIDSYLNDLKKDDFGRERTI